MSFSFTEVLWYTSNSERRNRTFLVTSPPPLFECIVLHPPKVLVEVLHYLKTLLDRYNRLTQKNTWGCYGEGGCVRNWWRVHRGRKISRQSSPTNRRNGGRGREEANDRREPDVVFNWEWWRIREISMRRTKKCKLWRMETSGWSWRCHFRFKYSLFSG